uniref:Uncharacterized protein n=1 Tax=Arundo donax TaxID=35708 RepID=A0A0A9EV47_ARUDO
MLSIILIMLKLCLDFLFVLFELSLLNSSPLFNSFQSLSFG